MQNITPVSYKIIARFHNELRDYFAKIYGVPNIIYFDYNNIEQYQQKVNRILYTSNDFKISSFISSDGQLKRLNVDLSDFEIKEYYKELLNINLDKLKNEYVIEHDAVRYFGFEINDMLSAGYMRIGWNKYKNQFYIQFDTTYCFPSSKVFDTIETIFLEIETLYVAFGNNNDYAIFSIKNGDSIKDIKHYFRKCKK